MKSGSLKQWNNWPRWLCLFCLLWVGSVTAQTVTLNLKDADIRALIGTVADITNKNFIVDPRVKGKITVISSRAMNSEEIYQVFLSILKVHGFAAVEGENVTKILPDVTAKQDNVPNASDGAPGRGDEMVTRIIQVDNIAAAQLVPILRPLIPQQGHLAAYPVTNVLIISDRAQNVSRLVAIIRKIDKASDSEIEVIKLEHASAAEVVRIVMTLFRGGVGGKGAPPGSSAKLIADERTNSILIGGERSRRLRIRAIITHLDTPLETGGNTKVIYLKYAKAVDLLETLVGVSKTKTEDAKGQSAAAKNIDKQLDIQAHETTNSLVITAPPDIMRSLESVIRQLDIRRAQVLVDAIIAEVGDRKSRELGVQWLVNGASGSSGPLVGTNFTNSGVPASSIVTSIVAETVSAVGNGIALGLGQVVNSGLNWGVVLQALAADTDVNILSKPSLVTLDNEEAEIIVGQNVPFLTGSFSNTGGSSSSVDPFQTIQREDVGITLKVKPQINEGNSILMAIEQEVSSISNSAQASDLITDKRSIKTNVLVEDGQIIVLGGLIEDRVTETEQKVPLLGDIPLLGYLFRSKSTSQDKVNLMVFIHPTILRDRALSDSYSAQKYNLIRGYQIDAHPNSVPLMPGYPGPRLPDIDQLLELPPSFDSSRRSTPLVDGDGSLSDG